jgi:hypothetical protein
LENCIIFIRTFLLAGVSYILLQRFGKFHFTLTEAIIFALPMLLWGSVFGGYRRLSQRLAIRMILIFLAGWILVIPPCGCLCDTFTTIINAFCQIGFAVLGLFLRHKWELRRAQLVAVPIVLEEEGAE